LEKGSLIPPSRSINPKYDTLASIQALMMTTLFRLRQARLEITANTGFLLKSAIGSDTFSKDAVLFEPYLESFDLAEFAPQQLAAAAIAIASDQTGHKLEEKLIKPKEFIIDFTKTDLNNEAGSTNLFVQHNQKLITGNNFCSFEVSVPKCDVHQVLTNLLDPNSEGLDPKKVKFDEIRYHYPFVLTNKWDSGNGKTMRTTPFETTDSIFMPEFELPSLFKAAESETEKAPEFLKKYYGLIQKWHKFLLNIILTDDKTATFLKEWEFCSKWASLGQLETEIMAMIAYIEFPIDHDTGNLRASYKKRLIVMQQVSFAVRKFSPLMMREFFVFLLYKLKSQVVPFDATEASKKPNPRATNLKNLNVNSSMSGMNTFQIR